MNMKKSLNFSNHFSRTASLCAAALAIGLTSMTASALEISGLIKVNGVEMSGVLVAAYNCDDSTEYGVAYSGATDASSGTAINFSMTVPSDNVRLELYYTDSPDTVPISERCRAFVVCGQLVPSEGKATFTFDMSCGSMPEAPGVSGHGYWKNHPDAWPVDSLMIGGRSYTKAQIIAILRMGEKGDKTKHMLRELVAAKLNVAAGNDGSCVQEAIDMADEWLTRFPVYSGVRASSLTWKRIMGVVKTLADYNEGELCAAPRND